MSLKNGRWGGDRQGYAVEAGDTATLTKGGSWLMLQLLSHNRRGEEKVLGPGEEAWKRPAMPIQFGRQKQDLGAENMQGEKARENMQDSAWEK